MKNLLPSAPFAVRILAPACLLAFGCTISPSPALDSDTRTGDARSRDLGGDGAPGVVSCVGRADGDPCGADGFICVGERCAPSRCGDGYVDSAAGEECDDNNDVPRDGCFACRFNCTKPEDCDDALSCNGTELCDTVTHRCGPGNPADDGVTCTRNDGKAGVCNGGVCAAASCGNKVVEAGEECDDQNTVNGDGCDNDCTFTCTSVVDCTDGDICNGEDSCDVASHTCQTTAALVCKDDKDCTKDTCDPASGCTFTPIDNDGDKHSCENDCDDEDPSRYFGAPEYCDSKDNDCNNLVDDGAVKAICYADADEDGFAKAGAAQTEACICPDKTTTTDPTVADQEDCSDSLAAVHPTQATYFEQGHCVKTDASGTCTSFSWDYDCDGVATKQWTTIHEPCNTTCGGSICHCLGGGWALDTVAECGEKKLYTHCGFGLLGNCKSQTFFRVQACR